MTDTIYTSKYTLEPDVAQKHIFSGTTKYLFFENKGYEPISIFFPAQTDPVTLIKKEHLSLKTSVSEIDMVSHGRTYLDIIAVVGPGNETKTGFYVYFYWNTPSPVKLKDLYEGAAINEITVKVIEPFSAGTQVSVGFDSDNEKLAEKKYAKLINAVMTKFYPYYISDTYQEMKLYIYGTPTEGKAVIFIGE